MVERLRRTFASQLVSLCDCALVGDDQTAPGGVTIHSGIGHPTARATLFAHLLNSSTIY